MPNYTEELAYVQGLTPLERRLYFARDAYQMERLHLDNMIASMKEDDSIIEFYINKAREHVANGNIELAELLRDVAQSTKEQRYTLADVRKQRGKDRDWETR